MEQKFFKCAHCGNIIEMVEDKGVIPQCCGEEMKEIKAGTVDAAKEKHIPQYTIDGSIVTVKVGSVEHPMTEAHYIAWIDVQTNLGIMRKTLAPTDKSEAQFALLNGEKVLAVYAYCNLHGLWKN